MGPTIGRYYSLVKLPSFLIEIRRRHVVVAAAVPNVLFVATTGQNRYMVRMLNRRLCLTGIFII